MISFLSLSVVRFGYPLRYFLSSGVRVSLFSLLSLSFVLGMGHVLLKPLFHNLLPSLLSLSLFAFVVYLLSSLLCGLTFVHIVWYNRFVFMVSPRSVARWILIWDLITLFIFSNNYTSRLVYSGLFCVAAMVTIRELRLSCFCSILTFCL